MEFSNLFVAFVLFVGLVHSAEASCQNEVMQSQGFQECIQGYSGFLANAAGNIQQMCSQEGKSAMSCITVYLQQCPELKDSQIMSGVNQMEAACSGFNGGGTDGGSDGGVPPGGMDPSCMAIQQCMASMSGAANPENMPSTSDSLGLSMVQYQVGYLCGPVKEMVTCMDKVSGNCPQLAESMNQAFGPGSGMPPGMSYQKMTSFVKDYCSSVPSDFGSNACVKRQLEGASSSECFKEASAVKEPTCGDYKNILDCIQLDECGSSYKDTLNKIMSFFLSTASSMQCDLSTSDSSALRSSLFSIVTAVIMMFRMF